jgi:hypothetical protein
MPPVDRAVNGKTASGWTNASRLRSCHDARLTHSVKGFGRAVARS